MDRKQRFPSAQKKRQKMNVAGNMVDVPLPKGGFQNVIKAPQDSPAFEPGNANAAVNVER